MLDSSYFAQPWKGFFFALKIFSNSDIFFQDGVPDVKWNKIPSPDALGSFELLLDEELAAQAESAQGGGRKVTKWK